MKITPPAFFALAWAVSASSAAAAPPAPAAPFDPTQVIPGEIPPPGYARPPFHVRRNSATGPVGYAPAQIRHFYGFDQIAATGKNQVIAIVDAYDDPNIGNDLSVFKSAFGIGASQCAFQKIYASGRKPVASGGWSLEMALDVEWACAIAPDAKIVLVEAASSSFSDLMKAVDAAVKQGAQVVSMSWGGSEFSGEANDDTHFSGVPRPVIFTASSGDSGNGVEYPAASPFVLAVGGTAITLGSGGGYGSESAWSGSGGGVSAYEAMPGYQGASYGNPLGYARRAVPDVAYDADPSTGVAVYSSVKYYGQSGWFQVGGTSMGAPQWAAFTALVDSLRTQPLATDPTAQTNAFYAAAASAYATDYHDVTGGSNGSCGAACTASAGYDLVTGFGSGQVPNLSGFLVTQ